MRQAWLHAHATHSGTPCHTSGDANPAYQQQGPQAKPTSHAGGGPSPAQRQAQHFVCRRIQGPHVGSPVGVAQAASKGKEAAQQLQGGGGTGGVCVIRTFGTLCRRHCTQKQATLAGQPPVTGHSLQVKQGPLAHLWKLASGHKGPKAQA